jgi:type 1 glutamine amidotransferase
MVTIERLGKETGLWDTVIRTDTEALTKRKLEYNAKSLDDFDAVVFYTGGTLEMDASQQADFLSFVHDDGKGFIGIHSATITFTKWPAYGEMIGGYFDGHPWHEKVRVKVEDPKHPATAHLGPSFEIADEIYQFKDWDRKKLHVLLSLVPESVDLTKQGVKRADHDFANAWTREHGKGRVFYTALGHREEVWADPRFLTHLVNGIAWTLREAPPARPAAATGEEGFSWLLQAATVPPGWKQAGPGGFKVDNGVATAFGGMGLWYYAPAPYKDFVLRLQYRQAKPSANSGVFVRFPRVDGDPMIPVKEGFQVPLAVPQKPAGQWNDLEIKAVGTQYTVTLNGDVVNTYTGERSREGLVGLQNHGDEVSFRNVRIKELR